MSGFHLAWAANQERVRNLSFRFFKRVQLVPGVTLNLSKSGPSLLFGPRGLKHTIGPRGGRTTVGLPGTGLSYTFSGGTRKRTAAASQPDDDIGEPRLLAPKRPPHRRRSGPCCALLSPSGPGTAIWPCRVSRPRAG